MTSVIINVLVLILMNRAKTGIINASPVAPVALLTTQGQPARYPAHQATKEMTKKTAVAAEEKSTTLEEVALQFSLRPPQECIATYTCRHANTKNVRI